MPNGKLKFCSSQVNPYNVEKIFFESPMPVLDNFSHKNSFTFCFGMTTANEETPEEPFKQS